LKSAEDAFKSRPIGKGGGFGSNPSPQPPTGPGGCPPNCGSSGSSPGQAQASDPNKTVVGAGGIIKSLGGK
jgi:hypothetical protein